MAPRIHQLDSGHSKVLCKEVDVTSRQCWGWTEGGKRGGDAQIILRNNIWAVTLATTMHAQLPNTCMSDVVHVIVESVFPVLAVTHSAHKAAKAQSLVEEQDGAHRPIPCTDQVDSAEPQLLSFFAIGHLARICSATFEQSCRLKSLARPPDLLCRETNKRFTEKMESCTEPNLWRQ